MGWRFGPEPDGTLEGADRWPSSQRIAEPLGLELPIVRRERLDANVPVDVEVIGKKIFELGTAADVIVEDVVYGRSFRRDRDGRSDEVRADDDEVAPDDVNSRDLDDLVLRADASGLRSMTRIRVMIASLKPDLRDARRRGEPSPSSGARHRCGRSQRLVSLEIDGCTPGTKMTRSIESATHAVTS